MSTKSLDPSVHVTQRDIEHYQSHGYLVLYEALTNSQLNVLHEEADILTNHLISEQVDLVHDLGCIIEPLTCGYLDPPLTLDYKTQPEEYRKRRNNILEIDGESSPLNEQYIIKPPRTASYSQFAWHRDSDYLDVSLQNVPGVACWTPLDPVNKTNGTLLLRGLEDTNSGNENKNYSDNEIVLELPAGSIVFMSNRLLHKSTGNSSALFRRVFMPQYSLEPICNPKETGCVGLAIKCTF
ncbi:hypothetical protein CLU79DRAFT_764300 [Phycomyces nitens]|nr:hypothetical protein CLU79DRAFT_764300 [Phycomyces nitens]